MEEEILINTLYTGDYTNKNIGHEIINLIKSENNGKVYVYITPYGFYADKHNVKTIILIRDAGTNLSEIVAIIKLHEDDRLMYGNKYGIPKEQKSFAYNKKYFTSGTEKDNKKQFKDIKKILLNNDEEYKKLQENYSKWESKQVAVIKKNRFDIKSFNIKKFSDYKFFDYKLPEDKLEEYNNLNNLEIKKGYNDWRTSYKEWLKKRSMQHLNQVKYIYCEGEEKKGIKYNSQFLNEIFSKNLHNDKTIHFTYEVNPEHIYKPKKTIYLKTIESGEKEDKCLGVENNTYKFQNISFRNQRCYKFIKESDNNAIWNKFKEITEKENLQKFDFNENRKMLEQNHSFMNILGMQYDEVCYSNMFAYFFNKYPQLFKKFAKEILGITNICINKTFEVRREDGRMDLLVVTDNDVIVIENKIKAKIHGENYDKEKNEYTNQLIKYYDETENNSDFAGKTKHYYIFKPNYNNISSKINIDEIIEKYKKQISNEQELRNKLNNINNLLAEKYKNIYFYDIYNNIKTFVYDKDEEIYFKEFLKALKKHSSDYDNTIEEDMKYKFNIAIQNVSE